MIEVKNVSKKFKKIEILENINVVFEEGKIYGLVGYNGSGKSVFLKMLCSFYLPTTGTILFDGVNCNLNASFPDSTRALIEKPDFIADLSGFENLKMLAEIQNKITDKEILEALKMVNLYEEKDKKFKNYSLGMKQKLGIAQVIMENPKVMIFDEPFNGIEKKTANELRELFLKLKKQNKIIIIATHIDDDTKILADEIYEFDNRTMTKVI